MCIWIFIIVILGLVSFFFFDRRGRKGRGKGGLRSVMILHCLIIEKKEEEEED